MGQKDTIMALVEQTNFSEQELKQYFKRFKKEHPDGKMDEKALRKMFGMQSYLSLTCAMSFELAVRHNKDVNLRNFQSSYQLLLRDFWAVQ